MARYRRALPVLGVVLLLVAVVVGLSVRGQRPIALKPSFAQTPLQVAPWPAGTWELTHQIDLPDGWTVHRREVQAHGSTSDVGGRRADLLPRAEEPRDFVYCQVTVLPPEQAMPRADTVEPVTVGGAEASYVPRDGARPYGVFWRGPDREWANVSCYEGGGRTETLALAELVRFTSTLVSVPLRWVRLPPDYQIDHLEYREDEPGQPILRSDDLEAAVPYLSAWYPRPPATADAAEEGVLNGRPVTMYAPARQLCFADEPVCVADWSNTDSVGNSESWPPGVRQLLVDAAAGLLSAPDLANPATWYTGREAFPG